MSEKRPLEIGCIARTCDKGVAPERARHAFTSPTRSLPGIGGECLG